MEDHLITLPSEFVPVVQNQEAGQLSTMTTEQLEDLFGKFLPRAQMYSSNSTPAKNGQIKAGNWGIPLTPSTIFDLGEEVDTILIVQRDKAILLGDELIVSTDKGSPLFQKIRAQALSSKNSDAMFGPEFLAWIGSCGLYVTIFLGSASARREAPAFINVMNKAAVLYSTLVGQGRRKWEVPLIRENEVGAFPFGLPTEEQTRAAVAKFVAKDEEPEAAEAPSSGRER